MNETIYRSLENPRVTMMPLEVTAAEGAAVAGTCPHHKQRGTKNMSSEDETVIIPDIVVRKDESGCIVGDANKRRELVDKFEKEHGLVDLAYPITAPDVVARVDGSGIIVGDLERQRDLADSLGRGGNTTVKIMTDSSGSVRQIIAERPLSREETAKRDILERSPLRVRVNARGDIWQEPEDRPW